ncbi:transporter, partial [Enterococcus faecalis]
MLNLLYHRFLLFHLLLLAHIYQRQSDCLLLR